MDKITLPLDINAIKSGELINLLPEFYELKNSIENSEDRWHQDESVFDHALSVMGALEKIISEHKGLEKTLDQKIDTHNRKTLMEIAAMFHDIGKKETMTKEEEFTKCIGHEKIGVEKTKKILERFDLSEKEAEIILDIIANHSVFHHLLNNDNPNFQNDLESLRNKFGESIYPELILLSYADTINSKLKDANRKEFDYRINFYKKETEKLAL